MTDLDFGEQIFAFPIKASTVLIHLNEDMRDDWFTDVLLHKDLFSGKLSLADVINDLLINGGGKYIASERKVYDIPKKGFGIRYSLETDFYDRFVYQSICSFLIKYYDPLLSNRVLGHRWNNRTSSSKYLFKNRIDLWATFEGVTKTAFNTNDALLVTDLVNYYENISIDLIRSSFKNLIPLITASGNEKFLIRNAIDTLCELLVSWGYNPRHGLPQNRDASSFIANVVLNAVDHAMESKGYDYYRYVDDIRIICKDENAANKALLELIGELRKVGLNINSNKTCILTNNNSKDSIDAQFPSSDDRTITIDNMWKSRSRRVVRRSVKYIYEMISKSISNKETQSRQFRFAVNRLIRLATIDLFDANGHIAKDLKKLLLDSLAEHPASADQYCKILSVLSMDDDDCFRVYEFLSNNDVAIHSWQNYHLWLLLSKRGYKHQLLVNLAKDKIENNILSSEVSVIFIYLKCVDETDFLKEIISMFSSEWPYYHQRNFLLSVSSFSPDLLKPIVPKLGPKLIGTINRAKPYFSGNRPVVTMERAREADLYDRVDPYA